MNSGAAPRADESPGTSGQGAAREAMGDVVAMMETTTPGGRWRRARRPERRPVRRTAAGRLWRVRRPRCAAAAMAGTAASVRSAAMAGTAASAAMADTASTAGTAARMAEAGRATPAGRIRDGRALAAMREAQMELDQGIEEALASILDRGQYRRLEQIQLQAKGIGACCNPTMIEKLNLEEDQVEQIRELFDQGRQVQRENGRAMSDMMRTAFSNPGVDGPNPAVVGPAGRMSAMRPSRRP